MSLFKEVAFPGKYRDDNAIYDLVNYIMQPKKTQNEIVDGMHVADNDFAGSMVRVSERFHKNSGIRLRHFIVSFQRYEVKSLGVFICIGREICRYIGQEYQVVYALHLDTEYPHFHFVFNAVSFVDGHRYKGSHQEYHNLINHIGRVVRSYGIRELKPVSYTPNPSDPHE